MGFPRDIDYAVENNNIKYASDDTYSSGFWLKKKKKCLFAAAVGRRGWAVWLRRAGAALRGCAGASQGGGVLAAELGSGHAGVPSCGARALERTLCSCGTQA